MHIIQTQYTRQFKFLFHIQLFVLILITSYSSLIKADTERLLILGDSLSAAYGISEQDGWVALLQKQLTEENIKIVNASISGETTSGGKNRLPALLKKYQPKWIIVELGANDALRGQNLKITKQNLQQIITQSQQQGTKVLLLGIKLPTNYGMAYDKILQKVYKNIATKNNLLFDPFFLETVALNPKMMQADALHPNEKAQPFILNRLKPLIKQLLD